MAVMKIDDKFTSSTSDTYTNDSDFIQNIVLSGHTSYSSLMAIADSDNISAWKAAGGIGILFKSTEQVKNELSKIGL